MSLASGTRIGVYEIVAPLGSGAMGDVYHARDPRLERDVAIKTLPPAVAADPGRRARFEREARALAALSHPNILAVHDVGTDGGIMYVVTELLQGRTLRAIAKDGPLPARKAVEIACQIARGLDAAHTRGIIHRDIKPENLMVAPGGHVKILDFGLAADRPGDGRGSAETATAAGATQPGALLGTPGYMAPEQIRGEAADPRSDIFALGCVLYEMLSGSRAFQGASSIDVLHATLHTQPRDLVSPAGASAPLSRIVSRCLEKAAEDRFQSARDLVFALEAAGDPGAPGAVRGAGRRRMAAVGALLVVAAAAVGALWPDPGRRAAAPESGSAGASGVRGIAVLPFESIGPAEHAYFATGVTEEVTLQLAKVSALRVISRNAVARFKGGAAELPAMARELRIGAVLTGSVRHAGNAVRIGVQLIEAPDGETLWSSEYNGDLANILGVQSDVAIHVARSLQATLAPEERARIERPPTVVPQAYELFLKSQPLSLMLDRQNRHGIELLERAVALDPKFALAYATVAKRYLFRGQITGRADYLRGVDAARTAVRLDPQLSRAHYALAISLSTAGDTEASRLSMLRAIELDSSSWNAIMDFSMIEAQGGRLDQAMYWARRGLPLAPNLAFSHYHLAFPLLLLDDEAAERWLLAAAARFPPTDPTGGQRLQAMLAVLDFRRGRAAAALERMRAAVAALPDGTEGQVTLTELAFLGGAPDAAGRIDKALASGPGARAWWTPTTPRTMRAFLWLQAGDEARARPLIDDALAANRQAIDQGDRSYAPRHENAALSLMRGDRAAALDWLDQAVTAGWYDAQSLIHDPLFAGLAGDRRFEQVLDRIRRGVREMRTRVELDDLEQWMTGSR